MTTKAQLTETNTRLSRENEVLTIALVETLAERVKWFRKGPFLVGICGEKRGCGGVVIVRQFGEGKADFNGAHYWETWANEIRAFPFRSDDSEGLALREVCEEIARHVRSVQAG